ncbi:hypothetical protein [Enterobacter quasiroggenkampii]|uniref:hypothetical protein n=1 Tax=Enterobacter quasiroggenkampii TaxID=2497436 RepID=UPI0039C3AA27
MKITTLMVMSLMLAMLSGCTTMSETSVDVGLIPQPTDKIIPLQIPKPILSLDVYDKKRGARVDKDVLSLTSKEIRERLTSTETFVTIEKYDASGRIGYLGANAKASKGSYKVTFDYINYTIKDITPNQGSSEPVQGRIGVGLRITADLTTTSNGVDLSNLLPIALAVQENKAYGQLKFLAYGISNDKVASLTPTYTALDIGSIQKALEAIATVRILFNLDDTKLEPYLLGVSVKGVTESIKLNQ